MEILLIVALAAGIAFLYQYGSSRRENLLARRLEKLHDPNAAASDVDAAIASSKIEAEMLRSSRNFRR